MNDRNAEIDNKIKELKLEKKKLKEERKKLKAQNKKNKLIEGHTKEEWEAAQYIINTYDFKKHDHPHSKSAKKYEKDRQLFLLKNYSILKNWSYQKMVQELINTQNNNMDEVFTREAYQDLRDTLAIFDDIDYHTPKGQCSYKGITGPLYSGGLDVMDIYCQVMCDAAIKNNHNEELMNYIKSRKEDDLMFRIAMTKVIASKRIDFRDILQDTFDKIIKLEEKTKQKIFVNEFVYETFMHPEKFIKYKIYK